MIPNIKDLLEQLRKQKQYQDMLGIKTNCVIDGYSGFVFTTKKGKPIQPNCLNRVLDLRHTACTRMAEKGIDVKTLQYIMGHSNISVTMDIYNHVLNFPTSIAG